MPEINGNIVILNPCSKYGAGDTLCIHYPDGDTQSEFLTIEEVAQFLS